MKVVNAALDAYGIPADLAERAASRLGRLWAPVDGLVRRTSSIRWLERAGQPELWDDHVDRVWTCEEAQRVEREFRPVAEAVWQALATIGKAAGRFEAMEAAVEYSVARFDYPDEPAPLYDLLQAHINFDMEGALREVVLEDLVSIRFFREALEWYEKGHWLCSIRKDGRRVVW